jgi:hypothetical protein
MAERLAAVTSSSSYQTDTPVNHLESVLRSAADIALEPIDAPRNGHLLLSDGNAYSVVTTVGMTVVLQYPLPPAN